MQVQFMKKIIFISSLALFAAACSKPAGDDPREGMEPGQCEDGADNDGDGLFDCDDSDCVNAPACGGNGDTGDSDVDNDGDGYTADEDCNDNDKNINPGAKEKCNNKDDDCDGTVDNDPTNGATYYEDWDGDGYGDPNMSVEACEEPFGYVANDDDCDDTNSYRNPGATETSWNGVDEDCDGSDFAGKACLEESADYAQMEASYYYYGVADTKEDYFVQEIEVVNQKLYYDGQSATVAGNGTTEFEIVLESFIAMNDSSDPFSMIFSGIYNEDCYGSVPWMPLNFEGTVSLTVNGTDVSSDISLTPVWDGFIQDDVDLSGCNAPLINEILGYAASYFSFPFPDLMSFLDNSYADTIDALANALEYYVEDWTDWNCDG